MGEPTMRLKIGFRKRIQNKVVISPLMADLRKALELIKNVTMEISNPSRGMNDRVDKHINKAHEQTAQDESNAVRIEAQILSFAEQELEARKSETAPASLAGSDALDEEALNLRRVRSRRAPTRFQGP